MAKKASRKKLKVSKKKVKPRSAVRPKKRRTTLSIIENKSDVLLQHTRFIGISLSGAKNDRTALVVLDYYPAQKKLFLTNIYEHIRPLEETSGDEMLLEIIKEHSPIESIALDAPLQLPLCVDCKCKAQNIQNCDQPEVEWMWKQYRKMKKKKPKAKLFTPYTTRACDMFIADEIDGDFHPPESLGANVAPLAARVAFLQKRLKDQKLIEIYPRVSVWRVGRSLKVVQSHLKHYKHAVGGDESRQIILQAIVKNDLAFIYHADFLKLAENSDCFDAFFAAITGFLKHTDQCEKPPKDFPNQTGWVEIPLNSPEFY